RSVTLNWHSHPIFCLKITKTSSDVFDVGLEHVSGLSDKNFGNTEDLFDLGCELKPLMSEVDLFDDTTGDAFEMYHSPYPFNRRQGHMKRAEDISLVKRAYNERPGSGEPTKVKVSHQKLLKKDVFNALKR
ncbi:hypothetical protein OGAPHI_006566, partial [Ogataea philodendri]